MALLIDGKLLPEPITTKNRGDKHHSGRLIQSRAANNNDDESSFQ